MRAPSRVLGIIAIMMAGCIAPLSPAAVPAPGSMGSRAALPAIFAAPFAENNHSDVKVHGIAYNFVQTDHEALAGSPTHSSGAHALTAKDGWLFVAVYGGTADDEGGFFIFNLSDPAHPKETGRYRFPGPLGGDRSIAVTDDANWVVLGTEAVDCAGHVNPVAPGLYLIDVRDKTNPQVAAYLPNQGVHSVTVHRIKGEDYVFALMTGKNIIHIVKQPFPQFDAIAQVTIGHDSIVTDDNLSGKTLLYASNGGAGFTINDVSDPASPRQIAEWNIPNRGSRYYIHTSAVQIIHDRRIVVVSSEDWQNYPSAFWVLDASSFGVLQTLSNWSAPGNHSADGLRFSMHNPRFMGSTLILAYYHAGVWAIDLSTPQNQSHPQPVGLFVPGDSNGWNPQPTDTHAVSDASCGAFHLADAPLVFDVEPYAGYVYVADLPTGLYTIKPTW
ncbi:MAG: LVIVD repeat-containing protein [Thermoplasmatota archaeon]